MKPEDLTKTVALFQSPHGHITVCSGTEDFSGYVRITEPVVITFTPRATEEVMAAAVAVIDKQIGDASAEIVKLEARKADLLALPAAVLL